MQLSDKAGPGRHWPSGVAAASGQSWEKFSEPPGVCTVVLQSEAKQEKRLTCLGPRARSLLYHSLY